MKLERRGNGNEVVRLINSALDTLPPKLQTLTYLASRLSYRKEALWSVYHEQRKMPLMPLTAMCGLLNIMDGREIIAIYNRQPKPLKPQKGEGADGFD